MNQNSQFDHKHPSHQHQRDGAAGPALRSRSPLSHLRIWATAAGISLCLTASAADRAVRPASDVSYNGDGTSWAAATSNGGPGAYRGLPAGGSLIRGDTYYIAGGSYPGWTLNTPASSTTPITIKKATVASHGPSTGWSNSMGDTQATFSGMIQFTTRYWVFDGAVGGGPNPVGGSSSWKTGHGFKVTEKNSVPVIWVNGGGNVDISHVELQGAGRNGAGGNIGNDGLQIYGGSGPVTLSHAYMHSMGRCMFYHGGGSSSTMTASHLYTGQHESVGAEHSEWAILRSSALFTVRWSIITHTEGTGGVIAGDNGQTTAEIYGNVFFADGTSTWGTENNGLIAAFSTGSAAVNWKVYNNTFINIPSGLSIYGISGQSPSGNQARNNYYYLSTSHSPGSGWTQSYEHFQNSGSATGSSSTTGSGIPFANFANYDFRLNANTTAGTSLASPYNVDMFGKPRTSWTRGAIEFGTSQNVLPPSNPRVQISTP
ncbi:MAG TPA: hypothetical protein VL069_03700 [Opitutus sp.]|nr:hypothetical protein [Opitutus sp.]